MSGVTRSLMWSEACEMLARAERLRQVFFTPSRSLDQGPVWEPPVDVLETDTQVLVLMALPGVDPDQVEAAIDGTDLVVLGTCMRHADLPIATIHRLELPQGRFARRIALPVGRYTSVARTSAHGCIAIILQKAAMSRG